MFHLFQNKACLIEAGRNFQNVFEHTVSCDVYIIRENLRPLILPCLWLRFTFELPFASKTDEVQRTAY